jgi:hypothetical protein
VCVSLLHTWLPKQTWLPNTTPAGVTVDFRACPVAGHGAVTGAALGAPRVVGLVCLWLMYP